MKPPNPCASRARGFFVNFFLLFVNFFVDNDNQNVYKGLNTDTKTSTTEKIMTRTELINEIADIRTR
jgi:hypothetical protein